MFSGPFCHNFNVILLYTFIFKLFLWTYPFLLYKHPYQACGDDWPHVHPFISLCNLKIFLGSFPISDLLQSCSSPPVAMFSFHSPLSSTPYPYNWDCINFHCDATCRPHSLHIHFMLLFYITLHYPFMQLYIVHCMYTHVISYLVLKGCNSQQGTHLSSLVYSPKKEWQAR